METIRFDDVTFEYPGNGKDALKNLSFTIRESEFILVCGRSGCGKTTLLRMMKKELTPYGRLSGRILCFGTPIGELDDRTSAARVGFVRQNPDDQIVTGKVWEELAFGLENLGLDHNTIRSRVAETAGYFDMQSWFRSDTASLSGGQKQLLNLAGVMIMQPPLLLLDEPTSQLDPSSAADFLETLRKLNRDFGTTIVLSEHRLEQVFEMADRVMVMERGRISVFDTPENSAAFLAGSRADAPGPTKGSFSDEASGRHPMFYGLPSPMKIFRGAGGSGKVPLTIRDGRMWLDKVMTARSGEVNPVPRDKKETAPSGSTSSSGMYGESQNSRSFPELSSLPEQETASEPRRDPEMRESGRDPELQESGKSQSFTRHSRRSPHAPRPGLSRRKQEQNAAVLLKNVRFRYEAGSPFVLRDVNFLVNPGEFCCILGGNGVGKSTLLKAICSIIRPQRGRVSINGKCTMLPQEPKALFTEISVEDELLETLHGEKLTDREKVRRVLDTMDRMQLREHRRTHPYDLSGGEQQRLALGKILLTGPDIILLDEPTKGLDPFFKHTLAQIFKELTAAGKTLIMVSHDIEFCAEHADRCAMFFDGEITAEAGARGFFAGNSYYTTAANKMVRKHFPDAVTWEDAVKCITAHTPTKE